MSNVIRNLKETLRQKLLGFGENITGSVTIWAALTIPVIIGGGALSVDVARIYNMDNELQSAADALAKAGAAELDQRPLSITRATRAVENMVENTQSFSKRGGGAVEVEQIRFLKSLPENDYQIISDEHVTTIPSEARYVEVSLTPEVVNTIFPTSFISRLTDVTMSADSVAGFDQTICNTAPVFFCNPAEGNAQSIYVLMEDPNFLRRQIQFKSQGGGNSQYGPGNFGYLDPFGGNSGASQITEAIAIDNPKVCFSRSAGVRLRPGNIGSVRQGFNTRFDIYEGSFKSRRTDPSYAPAQNVTKGYAGKKACSTNLDDEAFGLPNDSCFADDSCTEADGRMGNGDWDFVEYLRVNHNAISNLTIEGTQYSINYSQGRTVPATPPSRYSMYRWEIDNFSIPGSRTYGNSAGVEEGYPTCHASGPSTTVDDRRIIHAALLNCGAIEASGERMNGRTDPLPVETFVKVFLTEPMGNGQDNDIWGEIVGPVVQGRDSVSNDQIAVVR